jgi:hypothetical protein
MLVEFDPSSGRLSGVKAGKTMNDWGVFRILGKENGKGERSKQEVSRIKAPYQMFFGQIA